MGTRKTTTQCGGDSENGAFWTKCPYCYYMYEYEKVYANCFLRCQNDKCSKGFHALAFPLPPLFHEAEAVEKKDNNVFDGENYTEISYGEGVRDEILSKNCGVFENLDDKNLKTEERKKECESSNRLDNRVEIKVGSTKNVTMRKKKSVAKSSKKLTGKGKRIKTNEIGLNSVDLELNEEDGEGDELLESLLGGNESDFQLGNEFHLSEVEFFEGLDDIRDELFSKNGGVFENLDSKQVKTEEMKKGTENLNMKGGRGDKLIDSVFGDQNVFGVGELEFFEGPDDDVSVGLKGDF